MGKIFNIGTRFLDDLHFPPQLNACRDIKSRHGRKSGLRVDSGLIKFIRINEERKYKGFGRLLY